MIDLGDVYPISLTVTDPNNNDLPVDPTFISLTITAPDGTITTAVIGGADNLVRLSTGLFEFAYQTFVTGRHTLLWTLTGAYAGSLSDEFYVAPADPGYLISLDEARTALRLPAGNTVNDEDLRSLIASCTPVIEDIAGTIITRSCDEWYDGGHTTITLDWRPLLSISSVVESYAAGYTRTLTNQDLSGGAFDSFGYTVDLELGVLVRRIAAVAAPFAAGTANVHVVYLAGRTTVPPNVQRATRRLVRWLYQTEIQGNRPANAGPESAVQTPSGYDIPRAVLRLLGPDVQPAAVG